MTTFIQVMAIGIVATLAMTGVLALLHGSTLTMADMMRALGSIFTKNTRHTFRIGVITHFLVGCLSAFIYIAIWSAFPFYGFAEYLMVGTIVGFAHGVFVSFLMIVSVAEHHPLARFRRVGFGVAIAYLAAHVVYGFIVGVGAGAFDPRFQAVEYLARTYWPLTAG